jgi:hypothetical protein
MSKTIVEILLLIPSLLYTGYLLFIADVIQSVMNQLDEAAFHRFLNLLDKTAMKSPYAIFVGTITFIGMFPYFIFYGFNNWWFTAGLVVFVIASIISKSFNLPIYKRVSALKSNDTALLNEERRKLQNANRFRAVIQIVSAVLMTFGLIYGLS